MRFGIWLFARVPPCVPYCFRGTLLLSSGSQRPSPYIVFSSELTRNFASVAF